MGGLTALHAVLRDQSVWDGVVLGTATIDVEWTWFLKCIQKLITYALPETCHVGTLD